MRGGGEEGNMLLSFVGEAPHKDINKITGYEFHDPIILEQAFTHTSYHGGRGSSMERLAFIGDAVLNLGITKDQCLLYPDRNPGKLTNLRAANVDTEKLARVALKHGLHNFLRHKIHLLGAQIEEFRDAIVEYPLHSSWLIDAPKVLADIVESLIGAIFTDCNNFDKTWEVAKKLLEPMITPETLPVHAVTKLKELCQRKRWSLKQDDKWKRTGVFKFVINDTVVGRAKYKPKRVIARNRAALDAYNQILRNVDGVELDHQHQQRSCFPLYFKTIISSLQMRNMFVSFKFLVMRGSCREEEELQDLKKIIGYKFHNLVILQQAFTHQLSKEGRCSSLERLAYIGDSVSNLAITKNHCMRYPDFGPGRLTKLLAANVDTEKLARVALKHGLHNIPRHNIYLLGAQIEEFGDANVEYPLHSSWLIDVPRVLADIVESLIGAIFMDCNNFDTTWEVAKKLQQELMITPKTVPIHTMTKLIEMCQSNRLILKMIDKWWKENGVVEFVINGTVVGRAEYRAKRV